MSRNEKKDLPFIATATVFAMLSGFLLIFLLPYDQLLAWSLFLIIETVICGLIVKKLLEARRRFAARLSEDSSSL